LQQENPAKRNLKANCYKKEPEGIAQNDASREDFIAHFVRKGFMLPLLRRTNRSGNF
jgi:hypothetical protein